MKNRIGKKHVLADHTKVGKKLVPPFVKQIGPLGEISWVKRILPELLWIGLIQRDLGMPKGVSVILNIARVASEAAVTADGKKHLLFGSVSSFTRLSNSARLLVIDKLGSQRALPLIQRALAPLVTFYPECPLRFMFPSVYTYPFSGLEELKDLVSTLADKTLRESVLVQATCVMIAFEADILKVREGLALASFSQVEKYPETDLSKKVAASIRMAAQMFFVEPQYDVSWSWPSYFWNHGLAISPCTF
jgi:hypothetical protein